MSLPMSRWIFALAAAALAVGCAGGTPEMRVIGVHDSASPAHEVVFMQVSNPASHAMRLTKLEYTFAAETGKEVCAGEVELAREVPAGAAVIVEVPLDTDAPPTAGAMTLHGTLTAELDRIERSFPVTARVHL